MPVCPVRRMPGNSTGEETDKDVVEMRDLPMTQEGTDRTLQVIAMAKRNCEPSFPTTQVVTDEHHVSHCLEQAKLL